MCGILRTTIYLLVMVNGIMQTTLLLSLYIIYGILQNTFCLSWPNIVSCRHSLWPQVPSSFIWYFSEHYPVCLYYPDNLWYSAYLSWRCLYCTDHIWYSSEQSAGCCYYPDHRRYSAGTLVWFWYYLERIRHGILQPTPVLLVLLTFMVFRRLVLWLLVLSWPYMIFCRIFFCLW